jgi:methylthioribose-1-phosphate isomerase
MSAVQSPLFEPVLWEGNGFRVLDEILIPQRLEYITVTEVSQALAAVRDMKTRAYGQVLTFLYTAALVAQQYKGKEVEPLRQRMAQLTQQFCDVRPTFDFRGLGCFIDEWFNEIRSDGKVGETIARRAREFGAEITRARRARAKRAATLLPNPASVMTHCNVSGELVAVAKYCKELGKKFSVIATETRPYLQGARLTAWELAQAGVPVSLIPDCAVAQVMAKGVVDAVIVGADRSAQNGDIINKVGTYPLALMAKEYGVPFYALVQDPRSLVTGDDVPIEERSAAELLFFEGEPLIASGVERIAARYPAFDMTPAALITHLIGFDDVYTPETFSHKFRGEAAAAKITAKQGGKYLLIYGVPPKNQYSFLMSALRAEQCESFLVPEMRPQLCGAQVVARQLLERNAPTTLISDNIMGTLFAHREIRKLCLFSQSVTEAGPTGLCGSLLAVQLARLHGVPIELFNGDAPNDSSRDRDVSTFMGKQICPEGVAVRAVEVEVVPWALFKN